MPEGAECRVVADVIYQGIGQRFDKVVVKENVAGKVHRFSKTEIKNFELLQRPFWLTGVATFGKLIAISVFIPDSPKGDYVILNTLGMSGTWTLNQESHRHARLSFQVDDFKPDRFPVPFKTFDFIDPRCFGTIRIHHQEDALKIIEKIGPDLLNPQPDDEARWLKTKTRSWLQSRSIGEIVMNQRHIAGIGNIYRAELLWRLQIDPRTLVREISEQNWLSILIEGRKLLREAYELGGTTVHTFEANGQKGGYRPQIYGKERCPLGHTISLDKCKGRTVWWCPTCVRNLQHA